MKTARRVIAICFFMSTLAPSVLLNAEEVTEQSREAASQLASELIEIVDLVLDHHVHPVTRQQMAHDCLAHAHQQLGSDLPADLVKELSQTVDHDGFRRILQRELTAMFDHNHGRKVTPSGGLAKIGVRIAPAEDQRVNEQLAANRYVGIGIAIGTSGGFPVMHRVFPGGPADQVGAKRGDQIVEVDGVSTLGLDLYQTIQRLRGAEGSELEIMLRHDGRDRTVKLTRAVVPMATVNPPLISQSGKTVGIELKRLSASNVHELRKINAELDANVETVVLDFRSGDNLNLHYGELLANALIDDDVIGLVMDRHGERRRVDAEPGTIFNGRRLFIVIDASTGGVLKWVAAALQDTGQGVLYGDPSTASAMTVEAMEVGEQLSVSLPTRVLLRANGDRLTVRSELLSSPGKIHDLQMQMVALAGTATKQTSGVLYPNRPFQEANNARTPANFHSPTRVRQLKTLIEAIERPMTLLPPNKLND